LQALLQRKVRLKRALMDPSLADEDLPSGSAKKRPA